MSATPFECAVVIWGCALTIGSAAFAGSPDSTSLVRGPIGEKLDAHLTAIARKGYSGAVIVAKDGEIILRKGYGVANRRKGQSVKPDTGFTIGAITKQFTGAANVKLEMEGKVRGFEKNGRHVADVPVC